MMKNMKMHKYIVGAAIAIFCSLTVSAQKTERYE